MHSSIIILSYNTRDLTLSCLSHFAAQIPPDWEIILVDNASTDHTVEFVEYQYPRAKVIRSARNLGFAGGNNQGVAVAKGETIILLNSDVIVDAQTLVGLTKILDKDNDAGIVSPKLMNSQGKAQAFAYGDDPSITYLIRRGVKAFAHMPPMHNWDIKNAITTQWVSGACMCIRKSAINQAGLMDEEFFLYFEDIDWCKRIREMGWKIIYDPQFQVVHLGGASESRRASANTFYYESMVKFYKKHYGNFKTSLLQIFLLPVYRRINRM